MRLFRVLFPLICCFSLAATNDTALRNAFATRQMFSLRDLVAATPFPSGFYAGEVACAFNATNACQKEFKSVLANSANPQKVRQIHHTLAYVALREGRYQDALQEMDRLLAVDPNDADTKDTRPIVEALSHFPDQAIEGALKWTGHMDDGKLPLSINGKSAEYFFDTGANLSMLTESDAKMFGLQVRDVVSGATQDVNGNTAPIRIGVAETVEFGGIKVRNVTFLVASNQQQPFVEMQPGQRGLIGLPVLRALGSFTWTKKGAFAVDRTPVSRNLSSANLCFEDLYLITQASFEGHRLPFVLDTGASTTDLWPRFVDAAKDLVRRSGRHEAHSVTGVGGEQQFEAISLPKVSMELGRLSVVLQPAHILQKMSRESSQWFYGNLGLDLLGQASTVTIDFRTMTLQLR